MKKQLFLFYALAVYFILLGSLPAYSQQLLFSAKLNGAQETPPVNSPGRGVAGLRVTPQRDTVILDVTVLALSSTITAAHVHEAPRGVAGPVLINLTPYINGNRITAGLTGNSLPPGFLRKLLNDSLYINVHTTNYPNGEIRGQLGLETDYGFSASLNGAQETPPVATTGFGLGVFNLSLDSTRLKIYAIVQDLSSPITAAHLHSAPPGVSGPVVEDLSAGIQDSIITIEANPLNYLSDLFAGNIYINVHTTDHPAGEIRGQLSLKHGLIFDSKLDGDQEIIPIVAPVSDLIQQVNTPGKGVASIKINSSLDTLWYDIVTTSLSGPIRAAHFHWAPKGAIGPHVLDLPVDTNSTRISGYATAPDLTDSLINEFLAGHIYINIHTDLYPDGEIRGQIYPLVREGFTLKLQGTQQVPPVATPASGSGLVSMDRDSTNVHFLIAATGLSSPLMMAHFHKAATGTNGPVIYTLTPFFQQAGTGYDYTASGFWTDRDTNTPFDSLQASRFTHDSIYVNIHTTDNPSGEIRGQVILAGSPTVVVTSVARDIIAEASVLVSPNPATDQIRLNFNSSEYSAGFIQLSDITGKVVSSSTATISNGENVLNIDLNHLQTGLYYLTIETSRGRVVRKIIKN